MLSMLVKLGTGLLVVGVMIWLIVLTVQAYGGPATCVNSDDDAITDESCMCNTGDDDIPGEECSRGRWCWKGAHADTTSGCQWLSLTSYTDKKTAEATAKDAADAAKAAVEDANREILKLQKQILTNKQNTETALTKVEDANKALTDTKMQVDENKNKLESNIYMLNADMTKYATEESLTQAKNELQTQINTFDDKVTAGIAAALGEVNDADTILGKLDDLKTKIGEPDPTTTKNIADLKEKLQTVTASIPVEVMKLENTISDAQEAQRKTLKEYAKSAELDQYAAELDKYAKSAELDKDAADLKSADLDDKYSDMQRKLRELKGRHRKLVQKLQGAGFECNITSYELRQGTQENKSLMCVGVDPIGTYDDISSPEKCQDKCKGDECDMFHWYDQNKRCKTYPPGCNVEAVSDVIKVNSGLMTTSVQANNPELYQSITSCALPKPESPDDGYVGCYVDSVTDRRFPNELTYATGKTWEKCKAECKKQNGKYIGWQWENRGCFCGTELRKEPHANDSDCPMVSNYPQGIPHSVRHGVDTHKRLGIGNMNAVYKI